MSGRYIVREGDPAMPPIAWFHGFLGSPAMWTPVTAGMTLVPGSAFAVLPGHGAEPWYPTAESFDGAVEALAEALPFERAALVGYSMGARLALALALAYPERVAGAVLLGVDPGIEAAVGGKERRRWDDEQAERLVREGLPAFVTHWEALPVFATQRDLAEEIRAARHTERLGHTVNGLSWALHTLGTGQMSSRWSALEHAQTPLCFVAGASDTRFAAIAERASQCAPLGELHVIDGVGHDAALEAPRALAAVIEAFVTTRLKEHTTP